MKMDPNVLILYSAFKYIQKKRKNRRFWIHPVISTRYITGHFYLRHPKLEMYPEKFFDHFRMSKTSFNELLDKIKIVLLKKDTNMRNAVPPDEMLAVTLRYLASGNSLADIAHTYCIGRSTTGYIVQEVCAVIWQIMKAECIPEPTKEKWLQVADGFQKKAYFPHCIGAVDGKHIRIKNPHRSGSLFFNYKNFFSTILLAIADSNYCFVYVDIGSYGKDSDSTIFQNSNFWKKLTERRLDIPDAAPMPGTNKKLPYVFVGDEGFALSNHVQRPYAGKYLPMKKRIFNYRLTLARRYVECTFGILSNKWRIFHRPLDTSIDFCDDIVKACCILHNFVRLRDGFQLEDTLQVIGWEDAVQNKRYSFGNHTDAFKIRDAFANYFTDESGAIPWQSRAMDLR